MTPEELAEIETRAEAATEGPWKTFCPYGNSSRTQRVVTGPRGLVVFDDGNSTDSDARFIARARTDVPALIAEVRRLRTALSEIAEPEATPAKALDDYDAGYDMGFADGWNDAALIAQKALEAT